MMLLLSYKEIQKTCYLGYLSEKHPTVIVPGTSESLRHKTWEMSLILCTVFVLIH